MSPSEFQLRAALRDGEGDGVDPEIAIGRALQVRHARRVRIASVAAAIVLAGGVSGIVAINRGDNHPDTKSAADAGGAAAASSAAAPVAPRSAPSAPVGAVEGGAVDGGGSSDPSETAGGSTLGLSCPATVPVLSTPAGTGQFGANGPLFSQPVASLLVCGYGAHDQPGQHVELTDTAAATFAASLESASKKLLPLPCPYAPSGEQSHLDVLAVTASGAVLPPVVVTLFCNGTSTNGTAVRYNWSPPDAYTQMIAQLTGQLSLQDSIAPKRANGSPPA